MQVILLEKIRNLGSLGDKVSVKAGYGRNYLIPYNKAVFATDANLERFEQRRAELEKKAKDSLAAAEKRATKINNTTIVISAQSSDEGKLYGSVGLPEIHSALEEKGVDISKREITLPEGPFYSIGEYVVNIQLHSDVVAELRIEIVASK